MIRHDTARRCCITAAWLVLAGQGTASASGLPGTTLYAEGREIWVRILHFDPDPAGDPAFGPVAGHFAYGTLFRNAWNAVDNPAVAAAIRDFRIADLFRPSEERIFAGFTRATDRPAAVRALLRRAGAPPSPATLAGLNPVTAAGTLAGAAEEAERQPDRIAPTHPDDPRLTAIDVGTDRPGFVLVPEPVTLLLTATGLAGVGASIFAVRRRRDDDI